VSVFQKDRKRTPRIEQNSYRIAFPSKHFLVKCSLGQDGIKSGMRSYSDIWFIYVHDSNFQHAQA
jgi:hypothetical protein